MRELMPNATGIGQDAEWARKSPVGIGHQPSKLEPFLN